MLFSRLEHEPQPKEVAVNALARCSRPSQTRVGQDRALQQCTPRVDLHHGKEVNNGKACESQTPTDTDVSPIARTNARLSLDNVRIVSVRPWWKSRVSAVSYVAVSVPRVRYHAN